MLSPTNSYVSLVDAEAYFADRLDAAAWTEATETQKSQALVTAASSLEQYPWVGSIVDPSQPLAWPRNGQYFDPRSGTMSQLNGIPSRVTVAQMELAYHLLNNDGLLDETDTVEEVRVGPITVKGVSRSSLKNQTIRSLLTPLLRTDSVAVWRAN